MVAALVAGFAAPALAEAPTTFTVLAGGESAPENLVEVNAFLPGDVTVNVGDTVTWEIEGFHTVTFPGPGAPPPFIVPAPAGGPSPLMLNPDAVNPAGGSTYDGTEMASSGNPALLGGPPPEGGEDAGPPPPAPYSLTFTKAGTFSYVCLVHPEMVGTVTVQESGDLPMVAEDVSAAGMAQRDELIQGVIAKEAAANANPAQPVMAGVRSGLAESLHFGPNNLTVNVGDTVTWTTDTQDPHTVTFLSGADPLQDIIVQPQDNGPPLFFLGPQVAQPMGGREYDGTGIVNSGLLSTYPMAPGQPAPYSFQLTFTAPGTYSYYCVIHGPMMSGTITVLEAGAAPPAEDVAPTPEEAASTPMPTTAPAATPMPTTAPAVTATPSPAGAGVSTLRPPAGQMPPVQMPGGK